MVHVYEQTRNAVNNASYTALDNACALREPFLSITRRSASGELKVERSLTSLRTSLNQMVRPR